MDAIKLPIAADNSEDNNIGIVTFSKQLANRSQRGRPRIAVEPLGCLSLLDEGEQRGRPCALPSPDVRNENWITNTKVKTQPTVHIQRPRAVLSSPENDELSCELQQQTGKIANVASDAPKALLFPPKGLTSTGVRAIYVAENSISSSDSNDNSDFSPFSEDSLDPSDSRVTIPKVTERKPTGLHTMVERKTISGRRGNDESLLTENGENQVVKKQVCLPSAPSSRGLKVQTQKPMAKGNSGRVVRPWY